MLWLKNKIALLLVKLGVYLIKITKIDLITVAYKESGIGNSHSFEASGESYLIHQFLNKKLMDKNDTIIFDVGANVGKYSLMLRQSLPSAKIFSFEPNPETFEILRKNTDTFGISIFNFGLGKEIKNDKIFTFGNNLSSVNASSDIEVLKELKRDSEIVDFDIRIDTLDHFCAQNTINHIHFLKIDTEGFETEVLFGAHTLLNGNKIDIIQFEFNEVDVVKRVFLKDFYSILSNYEFYRLHRDRLIPLGEYRPAYEIFQFQNIIAINKHLYTK